MAQPALAQHESFGPGYVVTAAGDTLRGYVADQIDLQATLSASFQATLGAETQTFSPSELRGYGLENGRRFVSLVVSPNPDEPAQAVFARPLVEGDLLSLYEFAFAMPRSMDEFALTDRGDPTRYAIVDAFGTTTPLFYLRRLERDGSGRFVFDRQYARALASAFAGCPEAQQGTRRLDYRQRSLVRAVRDFNACMGSAAVVADAQGLGRRSDFGLRLGLELRTGPKQLTYRDSNGEQVGGAASSLQYGLRATADLQPNFLPQRLSIPGALSIGRTRLQRDTWFECTASAYIDAICRNPLLPDDFERWQLALSYGVRYTHPVAFASPYVMGGITHAYNVGDKEAFHGRDFPIWEGGYFGEAGFEVAGFSRISTVVFGLRYEVTGMGHVMPKLATQASSWATSSFSGTVGVRF